MINESLKKKINDLRAELLLKLIKKYSVPK